jgi:cell shape-determining protein MreC
MSTQARSFTGHAAKPTALSDLSVDSKPSKQDQDEVHLLREENKRLKRTLTDRLNHEFSTL